MLLQIPPRCEMYVVSDLGRCNHEDSTSRYGNHITLRHIHKWFACRASAGYLASLRLFVENNTFVSSLMDLIQVN